MSVTIESLLAKKGQFVSFKTERSMKVRKGQTPIVKISEFVARVGVTYDNMKSVKEKRSDGTLPEDNQGLPWGTWVNFPYLIEHKNALYLRCSATQNKEQHGKVQFYRDGVEISRDEAKSACLASEFASKSDGDVFNIKVDSIIDAH